MAIAGNNGVVFRWASVVRLPAVPIYGDFDCVAVEHLADRATRQGAADAGSTGTDSLIPLDLSLSSRQFTDIMRNSRRGVFRGLRSPL
jgi:hypothetical protein